MANTVIALALVSATVLVALYFLRQPLGGDLDAPATSVSNAPAP